MLVFILLGTVSKVDFSVIWSVWILNCEIVFYVLLG